MRDVDSPGARPCRSGSVNSMSIRQTVGQFVVKSIKRQLKAALFMATIAAVVQVAKQKLSRSSAEPVTKDVWDDVPAKPSAS
jgi:hypothetical protein